MKNYFKQLSLIGGITTLAALPTQGAVTFTYEDFGADTPATLVSSLTTGIKVDGTTNITATATAGAGTTLDINGSGDPVGANAYIGIGTNGGNADARMDGAETLTLSFNVDVIFENIAFSHLNGTERARMTTSGSAFDGLTYSDLNDASQDVGAFGGFGYNDATDSFDLQSASGGNYDPPFIFGVDGNSQILLSAGDSITFSFGGSGADAGGYAIAHFDVSAAAVPEPSSTTLIGLSGLLFMLRRRR